MGDGFGRDLAEDAEGEGARRFFGGLPDLRIGESASLFLLGCPGFGKPIKKRFQGKTLKPLIMGVHGLEPWTSSLSGTRSNQTELYAHPPKGQVPF